jgi:glycosyltransferase involved in cell wall biosynthesis
MRPDWHFLMFHQLDGHDDPFAGLPNVEHRAIDIRGDRFDLWQQIRLPLAVKKSAATLLHCPANTAPRYPLVPTVVTIHDLIGMEGNRPTRRQRQWARNVARAARTARRIITPSEFSKQQIVKSFGIPTDKIIVNYWAPDERCRKVTDSCELNCVRQTYGLDADRPYIFGFGAADPRKNTARIIDAFAALSAEQRQDHVLLLVGIEEPMLTAFRQKAEALNLKGSCFLYGFAAEQHLPALISGASVFCYPSLSEGFGLPILDAFVCETAVLTSNRASLPEVAGDAVTLVDPESSRAIADGLASLVADASLRNDLVARGRRRLNMFTWQACAERVGRIFEVVAEEIG